MRDYGNNIIKNEFIKKDESINKCSDSNLNSNQSFIKSTN